ncbi:MULTISPECIES: heme lyase CcmF/NrfE family subunit [Methylosinus]|uniref:C-type cytochrome biogenesis protein CcmF n=1 Tax=Methylosinus trichosporium (strain ATCC 35070 / NCIMB 11131 / UNIQEM 75 / OB3b) TaxID=595536 RepID=A0A2D2D082_METT3|nr:MULTISPECIES: heme lyase CcmF/NrfE family subunit [Methylosinus]ATQ68401.1 c-type cytochrome biogenesis protein CcmF [Methylosinus trichosporium OB3b]OBS51361.1 heme lyase CcmF/NrfE family subunit [Methylosinus sp. 3S-1]
MIVETGHFALILALALAIAQAILPFAGARLRDASLMRVARPAALAQFALVALAYGALTYAHVVSDFSLVNVIENSHSLKPMIYKISGVWGNHEGSMLLWVLVLSFFGALIAVFSGAMPDRLRADTLAVQGLIGAAFVAFILFTSNPFARVSDPPWQGRDLNPILQDPGLAIHPPLLYLGYVGFSIVFSFAAAALIGGRIDAAWARFVRPWTLAAWIFLTLGIAMGSYWAYYTLGWGGFWFWDPVENASLMPWLAGTALLHSAAVMEKREALKVWTIFLSILAFSLSLLGTFLVRSGVLTSVHAFASDPERGVFILAILVLFIGGALALFAFRAGALPTGGLFAPISREGALVVNNLLLTVICFAVVFGTLYPLALEALTGDKISVGAPFFNTVLIPIALPLVLLMPIGQMLAWKRGDLAAALQRLRAAFAAGVVAIAIFGALHGAPFLSVICAGLAIYLVVGAFCDIAMRAAPRGTPLRATVSRLRGLPLSAWGASIAHAGVGLTLLGLAATGWGVEQIVAMKPGVAYDVGPYRITIEDVASRAGPNYSETYAVMAVREGDATLAQIEPAKRFYQARRMARTEAGIVTLGLGQVYAALGEQHEDGTLDARLYYKPLVLLIWLGAVVMALGGACSLADRRLRIGVAARACVAAQAQAAE